jgi:hypothetical protein
MAASSEIFHQALPFCSLKQLLDPAGLVELADFRLLLGDDLDLPL